MKKEILLKSVAIIVLFFLYIASTLAQEEKKKITFKMKIEKEINGKKQIIDTTIVLNNLDELNIEELNKKGIFNIQKSKDGKDIKLFYKDIDIDEENITGKHKIIIKTNDNINIDNEDLIDMDIEMDENGEHKIVKWNAKEGTDKELKSKRIIMMKTDDSEGLEWIEEDIHINGDNKNNNLFIISEDITGTIKDGLKTDTIIEGNDTIIFKTIVNSIDVNDKSKKNVLILKDGKLTIDKNINIDSDKILIKNDNKDVKIIKIKKNDGTEEITVEICINEITKDELKTISKKGIKTELENDVEKLELNELNFYPNPSNGQFKLEFNVAEKSKTLIKIFDLSGKQVYIEKLHNFSGKYSNDIDLSSNKPGTYILQIIQGNKMLSKKLLIQ